MFCPKPPLAVPPRAAPPQPARDVFEFWIRKVSIHFFKDVSYLRTNYLIFLAWNEFAEIINVGILVFEIASG